MTCCGEDSVRVSKMALELKSGQMFHYKRRVFGKDWRNVFVVLYNDSTLAWYKDKGQTEQEGGIVIKDSPELMAYGQFTNMIPNRPDLPEGYKTGQLLAFGVRGKEIVHWLLCPTEEEVISWMTAISNTLPPPPQPPQQPPQHPPQPDEAPPRDTTPMMGEQMQSTAPPSAPSMMAPPPPYAPHQGPVGIPGQYPTIRGYPQQPYTASPLQPAYPYVSGRPQPQQQPSNTTVVVQDRTNNTGGDFAMGMLVGGAIGTTWARPMGWGCGWGWGGGGYHSGPTVNDTDININNYYDVDNTVVNNDVDIDASRDVTMQNNDFVTGDFDDGNIGGDFDAGDMGGDFDCDLGGF